MSAIAILLDLSHETDRTTRRKRDATDADIARDLIYRLGTYLPPNDPLRREIRALEYK